MSMNQKVRTLQNRLEVFGRCTLESSPPIKFIQPVNFASELCCVEKTVH